MLMESGCSVRSKKRYRAVLPLETCLTVIEQFGYLPVSIIRPQKRPDWDEIIGDEGDQTTRRSSSAKYLPSLRFSKFHPDLAEFCIRYWSIKGDLIVDPFAGRATRGIVARRLGRRYRGYEVAKTTYKITRQKIEALKGCLYLSDGCEMAETKNESADLVFTCPPYHRLERYESSKEQLSDLKTYEEYLVSISKCCRNTYRVLRPGRFAVFVVADWRDGKAFRPFHSDLAHLMTETGLVLWDTVVVHNNSPFAALQAGKVAAKRYTSKTHEYVMVFRKPEG